MRTPTRPSPPCFEVLGKPFLVGPDPGMGQMTKVMNNLLSVAALAVTSEALVLGQKAGLDPKVLIDVINVSSGQSNASMTKIPKYVLTRSFDFGFAIGLSNKDIRLCLEAANGLGVPMVVGSSVLELLKIANAKLGGEADLTADHPADRGMGGRDRRGRGCRRVAPRSGAARGAYASRRGCGPPHTAVRPRASRRRWAARCR